MERNERGEILVDIVEIAKATIKGYTRYNGGWIKRVEGIDKAKTNGYSLIGPFCERGLDWNSPGLYIDCSIGGSRRNHEKNYSLFALKEDGTAQLLETVGDTRDWAVRLWPAIEQALQARETDESELERLMARKQKLEEELKRIEERIEELKKLKEEGVAR